MSIAIKNTGQIDVVKVSATPNSMDYCLWANSSQAGLSAGGDADILYRLFEFRFGKKGNSQCKANTIVGNKPNLTDRAYAYINTEMVQDVCRNPDKHSVGLKAWDPNKTTETQEVLTGAGFTEKYTNGNKGFEIQKTSDGYTLIIYLSAVSWGASQGPGCGYGSFGAQINTKGEGWAEGTFVIKVANYSKSVKLVPCLEGKDDCRANIVKGAAYKKWFNCSEEFYFRYANPGQSTFILLFNANTGLSKVTCKSGKKEITASRWCYKVDEYKEERDPNADDLILGQTHLDIISTGQVDCKAPTCVTAQPYRKFLTEAAVRELARGGFPYIVDGSIQGSQVAIKGDQELYTAYTVQAQGLVKEKLIEDAVSRFRKDFSIGWTPNANDKNDPNYDPNSIIGFATKFPDPGDSEPTHEDKDVFTANMFYEVVSTMSWEMIELWKQTVEASLNLERDSEGNVIIPEDGIIGEGGSSVSVEGTALELEKMWIQQYQSTAYSAGADIGTDNIRFNTIVSATDDSGGDYSWSARSSITIKQLMDMVAGGEWEESKVKDLLTIELPEMSGEKEGVFELKEVKIEYDAHFEGNWHLNVKGGVDTDVPLHIQLKKEWEVDAIAGSVLTLNLDSQGKVGLDLSWVMGDGDNPSWKTPKMVKGAHVQTGLMWDNSQKKFTPSLTVSKTFADCFTVSLNNFRPDVALAYKKEFTKPDLYGGRFDLGFSVAASAASAGSPNAEFDVSYRRNLWNTGNILGNLVWKSSVGGSAGTTQGIVSGFSLKAGGWNGVVLENGFLEFFGLPINIHPKVGTGFSFFSGSVESTYFGNEWSGFKFAMNLGLIGFDFTMGGGKRKGALKNIFQRKRYPSWKNLWGILPFGGAEHDEDYVARVIPCCIELMKDWAEDDWEKFLEDLVPPSALVVKEYYYPLKANYWDVLIAGTPDPVGEIEFFYKAASKPARHAANQAWEPDIGLINKQAFENTILVYPDFLKEGTAWLNNWTPWQTWGSYDDMYGNDIRIKAYLYYHREVDLVNAGLDAIADASGQGFTASGRKKAYYYKWQKSKRQTFYRTKVNLGNYGIKSTLKKQWLSEYINREKSDYIKKAFKGYLPTGYAAMLDEIENLNEEVPITSQFFQQYMEADETGIVYIKDKDALSSFLLDNAKRFPDGWLGAAFEPKDPNIKEPYPTALPRIDEVTGKVFYDGNSALEKWYYDPYFGLVKAYWSPYAPHGKAQPGDPDYYWPYDPNEASQFNGRVAHGRETRPGWIFRGRNADYSMSAAALVIPDPGDPGHDCEKAALRQTFAYDKLLWKYTDASMNNNKNFNQEWEPYQSGTAGEDNTMQTLTGMAVVPWKENAESCYLNYYEYMKLIEIDALTEFMPEGVEGDDIEKYCVNKNLLIDMLGVDGTNNSYDVYLHQIEHYDEFGIAVGVTEANCKFSNFEIKNEAGMVVSGASSRIATTLYGRVYDLLTMVLELDELDFSNTNRNSNSTDTFSSKIEKAKYVQEECSEIESKMLIAEKLYFIPEMAYEYKKPTHVVNSSGGFVGYYDRREQVANLKEISSLDTIATRGILSQHGSLTQQGLAKFNPQNVKFIVSRINKNLSDPIDGQDWGTTIINSNPFAGQITLGWHQNEKVFSNTKNIADSLNSVSELANSLDDSGIPLTVEPQYEGKIVGAWPELIKRYVELRSIQLPTTENQKKVIQGGALNEFFGFVDKDTDALYFQIANLMTPYRIAVQAEIAKCQAGTVSPCATDVNIATILKPFIDLYWGSLASGNPDDCVMHVGHARFANATRLKGNAVTEVEKVTSDISTGSGSSYNFAPCGPNSAYDPGGEWRIGMEALFPGPNGLAALTAGGYPQIVEGLFNIINEILYFVLNGRYNKNWTEGSSAKSVNNLTGGAGQYVINTTTTSSSNVVKHSIYDRVTRRYPIGGYPVVPLYTSHISTHFTAAAGTYYTLNHNGKDYQVRFDDSTVISTN